MHAPTQLDERLSAPSRSDPGRGWGMFAGVMFLAAAAANALYGIAALVKDDYFRADELLVGNLAAWGVISLLFGAVQVGIGVLILRRQAFGAVTGIMVAALNGTVALCSIGAYPLWSAVVIVIDGLIIYGLTVHAVDWE